MTLVLMILANIRKEKNLSKTLIPIGNNTRMDWPWEHRHTKTRVAVNHPKRTAIVSRLL